MEKTNQKINWISLSTGMVACLALRLIPFRAPNVEPIFATQMPFAKAYGEFAGVLFGVTSVVAYDFITHTSGVWTLVTAAAYGMLGFFSARYFKNKQPSRKNFVSFAIMGTLFYDAVTGLTVGPLLFHQSFITALVGQIPFTALHLIGNTLFAAVISPVLYTFLLQHKQRLKVTNYKVSYQVN
ncbi:MAG: hypothetical protein WCO65_01925 [bacterium]